MKRLLLTISLMFLAIAGYSQTTERVIIDEQKIGNLHNSQRLQIDICGKDFDFKLKPFDPYTNSFHVHVDNELYREWERPDFYMIEDYFGVITVSAERLSIRARDKNGDFIRVANNKQGTDFVGYRGPETPLNEPFCDVTERHYLPAPVFDQTSGDTVLCLSMHYEITPGLTLQYATIDDAIFYVEDVHANTVALYARQGEIKRANFMNFWTTEERFKISYNSTYEGLNDASNYVTSNANVLQGGSMHVIHDDESANLGGVAYLNGYSSISSSQKVLFSNIRETFEPIIGIDSLEYSWTIEVWCHEEGHCFGSRHTHSCQWEGGAIDKCSNFPLEGTCDVPEPPCPTDGGTIMSYAHLSPFGINFNKGFHPQPLGKINQMRITYGDDCTNECFPPVSASVGDLGSTSATITLPQGDYVYIINNGDSISFSGTILLLTGLEPDSDYQIQFFTVCQDGELSFPLVIIFATICDESEPADGYRTEFDTPEWQAVGAGWEHGTETQFNATGWSNTLNGPYDVNQYGYIKSQCFDFTDVTFPIITTKLGGSLEASSGIAWDYVVFEYTTDNRIWKKAGTSTPTWYNDASGYQEGDCWGNDVEFKEYQTLLLEISGEPKINFRFRFNSDQLITDDGIFIDYFKIADGLSPECDTICDPCPPVDTVVITEFDTIDLTNYGAIDSLSGVINTQSLTITALEEEIESLFGEIGILIDIIESRNNTIAEQIVIIDSLIANCGLVCTDTIEVEVPVPVCDILCNGSNIRMCINGNNSCVFPLFVGLVLDVFPDATVGPCGQSCAEQRTIDITQYNDPFTIYPNPTTGIVNIDYLHGTQFEYKLQNNNGQQIMHGFTRSGQLDLNSVASGVYFLEVIINGYPPLIIDVIVQK